MGMSNLILDNEEMFYGGAQDIVLEYQHPAGPTSWGADEFVTDMMKQRDLVAHQSDSTITSTLLEIYYDG